MSPARPDRLTPRGGSPSVDHEVQSPPSDVAPSRHPQETSTAAPVASVEPMREPLFVDWPEPQWALLVTGRQRGYLEPCGCAGLENQKGGLMRRQTLIDRLANRGWRVVSVDVGNQVRRIGEQAEVKFDYSVEALRLMQYAAVGFGPDDLRLSATHLVKAITDDEFQPQLFASANVSLFDESFTSLYRIVTVGGRRVGDYLGVGVGPSTEGCQYRHSDEATGGGFARDMAHVETAELRRPHTSGIRVVGGISTTGTCVSSI